MHIHVDGDGPPAFAEAGPIGDEQDVCVDLDRLEKPSLDQDQIPKRISANAARAVACRELAVSPRKANGQARASEAYKGRLLCVPEYAFNILTK